MQYFKIYLVKNPLFRLLILIAFILLFLQSCKDNKKEIQKEDIAIEKENVVEVITQHMDFQMRDTIPSGWNTFRYKNQSPQTHFFLIDKYPEGKTSEDAEKLVSPVFDSAMELIMEGKAEEGFAQFANLPEWFSDVVFIGGTGLLSPNQTAETTLHLKPGNYIIECYVKMNNGMFHTSMGMTKDLVVSNIDSKNEKPTADISINISSTEGIVVKDSITAGNHTFEVNFIDQITHENFVGHDVNLVKLEENANIDELEMWMNWANPKGLIEPAPKAIIFMGGTNDMPTGNTGFFTANLQPGKYALIAEVPNAKSKNMLQEFEVK